MSTPALEQNTSKLFLKSESESRHKNIQLFQYRFLVVAVFKTISLKSLPQIRKKEASKLAAWQKECRKFSQWAEFRTSPAVQKSKFTWGTVMIQGGWRLPQSSKVSSSSIAGFEMDKESFVDVQ